MFPTRNGHGPMPPLPGCYPTGMRQRSRAPTGNEDPCNTTLLFAGSGAYNIPTLAPVYTTPTALVPWRRPESLHAAPAGSAIHFFLDDYRLEALWRRPQHHAALLAAANRALLTPDFSTFTNWPAAVNIYQVYKNRYLGALWQARGLDVVPAVGWSTPASFDYAFAGLVTGGVVAVQTQTINRADPLEIEYFRLGWNALVDRLEPEVILVYGKPPPGPGLTPHNVLYYPTFWDGRRPQLTRKALA